MSKQTYYLWDESGRPAGTVECDPNGPLPLRCTLTVPPEGAVLWRGGQWVPEPAPSLDEYKAKLREQATAIRWARETGGITFNGVRVLTGTADQNRIASVIVAGPEQVDFKAASGWVTLTLPELQAVAGAIADHVQACFTAERQHHEEIDALTEVGEYDLSLFWPAE